MNFKKNLVWLVTFVIVVVGLIVLIIKNRPADVGQKFSDLGNEHIEREGSPHQPYNSTPPTSGPHIGSSIASWGVHTEPVPDELQVHNLEDGGVMIQYQPDKTTGEEVAALEQIFKEKGGHIVVAPYPKMEYKIALTAWTRLLKIDSVDRAQIDAFIQAYEGVDHHK